MQEMMAMAQRLGVEVHAAIDAFLAPQMHLQK
jgi:hypothetical protein